MKKLIVFILALSLCAGCALCEAPSGWEYIPFDVMLDCGIIAPAQMRLINVFIAREHEMLMSGEWPEASEEMNGLYDNVFFDGMERRCSDEAQLAEVCTWKLVVIGIITVDQMSSMNAVIEFHNP